LSVMKSPRPFSHDRLLDCQQGLEGGLRDLINHAVIAEAPGEVFNPLASFVRNSRLAYAEDPKASRF
jgi:hypothetical protein